MKDHESGARGAHLRLVMGLKNQIREIDEEMERVARQQQEVAAAQEALERMESLLVRMSEMAREAAAGRIGASLSEEFNDCKKEITQLADSIELSGDVKAALEELAGRIKLTE